MDAKAVTGYSTAETWERSIELLLSRRDMPIVDTDTGGATVEIENVALEVLDPLAEPRVSDRFVNPQLIEGYQGVLTAPARRRPQEALTVADRMYAWPTSSGKNLDQVRRVVNELKSNPTSRRAIVQIWNPELDLPAKPIGTPSGQCFFYFSIRRDALNLTINSRSVDAWNGCLPNLVAFTNLQQDVARRLKVPVGVFTQFVLSYHIYVRDIPGASALFPEKAE